MGISAFLIAFNEEDRIGRALDALQWTDERVVIDSGSTDRTREISIQKQARVFDRPFDNFEAQKNFALSKTNNEWVLSIDADEIVSPPLAQEIQSTISQSGNLKGFKIKRKNYFLGKPLHLGGQGNDFVLRLFQKNCAKFSGIVHEEVVVNGPIGHLTNELVHTSTETLHDYFVKLKLYTDLDATRLARENRVPSTIKAVFYPPAKWFTNYVIQFGFLDRWHGFLYHALSCYYGWLKNFKARAARNLLRK